MTKTAAQLEREIAHFLANPKLGDPAWERDWANLLTEKHSKARAPTVEELARAFHYIESEYRLEEEGNIDGEQWAEGLAFGRYAGDADDKRHAREAMKQLPHADWLRIAERANALSRQQGESPRYLK